MNHPVARGRYGHPEYKIKPDSYSVIFEGRLAFLRGTSAGFRDRSSIVGLRPQRLDPIFRRRGHERLGSRFADEDLLLQVLPKAVELHMHLPFLSSGAVQIRLVPRVLRHQRHHPARGTPAGPAAALNRPDLGRYRLVEHDEVDLRDVEALFPDRGRDEDVDLARAELVEDVDWLLLREPDVLAAGRLAHEPHRLDARNSGELLGDPVRGLPVMREDDDFGVRLFHELFSDDPSGLRELRMLDLRRLRELNGLLDLRVLQELDVRLRLRVLLHVLEVQSEGAEALRLRELDGVVRLHCDRLRGHRTVEPAVLDAGVQTGAGLVSDRQQVLAGHPRPARKEPEFLQSRDLFIDDGLKELPDFLGDVRRLHRDSLDLQIVLIWYDVGVVFGADLDRGDAEVPAHLEDLLRGGPRRRGHPEDQSIRDFLVCRRDVDVRVVADRAMRLVEDDQAHVVEGDAFRPHVVPNHLGRRDDDLVLPPEEFAILGSGRLAREERDPVDDEDLPHRGRVLLDERLGRREEQDPTAAAPQDLRDDHRGDDRLAHSRRQDDEGRSLEARPRDVHLVRALLHGLPPEELVRHEHGGRTTQVSK